MSINHLSGSEILSLLNSGQYISSSTKKQLEEQLEEHKQIGFVNGIDEFFSMVAPHSNKRPKKQIMNFPSISQKSAPKSKKNLDNKHIGKMNFVKLIEKLDNEQQIEDKQKIDEKVVNTDTLLLSFNDIRKIYDMFSIHRIKMAYLICCRKIYLFDKFKQTNKQKWFDKFYDKSLLVAADKIKFEKCIEIYTIFRRILNNRKCKNNEETQTKYIRQQIIILKSLFVGFYEKYLEMINTISSEDIKIELDGIENLLQKILTDVDPHIECQYYVRIKTSNSQISPHKIVNLFEISFNDEINVNFVDPVLEPKTNLENDIDSLIKFHNNYTSKDNFIKITSKKFNMTIVYSLDTEIPSAKSYVKIQDLPSGYKYICSIIHNSTFLNLEDTEIIVSSSISVNNWMEKDSNKFVVDFLFKKLLDKGSASGIITNQMKESFIVLAKVTSKKE